MAAATAKKTPAKAETANEKTEAQTSAPTKSPYRSAPEFLPSLKSAKSLSKGNPELSAALQLITHLAWKTPSGAVGWTDGTTASVVSYADDLAVPVGTAIPKALEAALTAAKSAAGTDPQREAVGVLEAVLKGHENS